MVWRTMFLHEMQFVHYRVVFICYYASRIFKNCFWRKRGKLKKKNVEQMERYSNLKCLTLFIYSMYGPHHPVYFCDFIFLAILRIIFFFFN